MFKALDHAPGYAANDSGFKSVKQLFPWEYRSWTPEARKLHDAGFAFLQNNLAKVDTKIYKPLANVTYMIDGKGCIEVSNELVDSVEYYSSDYTGLADTVNSLFGVKGNIVPRVTGGLIQGRLAVFTFKIATEFSFVELEKMSGKKVPASIEQVHKDLVQTGWDLFVNKVFYTGAGATGGLVNHSNVKVYAMSTISKAAAVANSITDVTWVAAINTMLMQHLIDTNYNPNTLPDTLLCPTVMAKALANKISAYYNDYLINFISNHNVATATAAGLGVKDHVLAIAGRTWCDDIGTNSAGRCVLYKKEKDFIKLHIPFDFKPLQTGPDMSAFAYVTLYVGQVSELQLPYNVKNTEPGAVSYWDLAV